MIVLGQEKLSIVDLSNFYEIFVCDVTEHPGGTKYTIDYRYSDTYLGKYETEEEARYVLMQIYEQLLLHSEGYEMPSQEEVKDALECITASRGDK